jgi:predicted transcriptional regulator
MDVATSVKLLPNIKAALDKAAKADKRSVSSLLQKIISDWLEAHGFLK